MSKISVRTVMIASIGFILLISVFPLIQVLKSESRGVIDRGKYHEEIQVILENGSEWNGTHVVPYDAENEQYVYDVEYESYRLIPLKLVAIYPEDIGAILSYRFSEFASKKTYVSESGKTVKAYQDQIDLELIDIASGEIITKTTARAKLADESSIPVGYTTYFQTFGKEEIERISAWIHDAMKEYLGYNED